MVMKFPLDDYCFCLGAWLAWEGLYCHNYNKNGGRLCPVNVAPVWHSCWSSLEVMMYTSCYVCSQATLLHIALKCHCFKNLVGTLIIILPKTNRLSWYYNCKRVPVDLFQLATHFTEHITSLSAATSWSSSDAP